MQAKRGFTLVEILIVVVILGILAAIVIPQFTQASTEAKTNSLQSDLQSLRSQIELYKCQHNNDAVPIPEYVASPGPETWNQMVFVTDRDGAITTETNKKVRSGNFVCGPYLERVPENPFNGLNTIKAVTDRPTAKGDDTTGWVYIEATGEIYANNDELMPDNTTPMSTL